MAAVGYLLPPTIYITTSNARPKPQKFLSLLFIKQRTAFCAFTIKPLNSGLNVYIPKLINEFKTIAVNQKIVQRYILYQHNIYL